MAGSNPDTDVIVVGAGVLGVSTAYWISTLYDCSVSLIDAAGAPAAHTSSRNTGVIHRPFYLDPAKKRIFARTCGLSLPMWKALAVAEGLPWKQVGTFNVALEESEVATLEKYREWGLENGMEEGELRFLDGRAVATMEPEVRCSAGLLSTTDVSVDFGSFTRHLCRRLVSSGVKFVGGHIVHSVKRRDGELRVEMASGRGRSTLSCRLLVNAAGGGAIDIAHNCGLATGYAVLHFRGEYWVVDEPFASRVASNIYRPPRFPQFPFLDPHFVVRADGSRQIGPNAVMVPGPYVYSGVGLMGAASYLERPVDPKVRLLLNREFISLLVGEWRSSLSKGVMCGRVKSFVPRLDPGILNRRAVFGVRSSVVDSTGFVPEALEFFGERSLHVINYNSPGASGAPAYAAHLVSRMVDSGLLDGFREKRPASVVPGWDFETASEV